MELKVKVHIESRVGQNICIVHLSLSHLNSSFFYSQLLVCLTSRVIFRRRKTMFQKIVWWNHWFPVVFRLQIALMQIGFYNSCKKWRVPMIELMTRVFSYCLIDIFIYFFVIKENAWQNIFRLQIILVTDVPALAIRYLRRITCLLQERLVWLSSGRFNYKKKRKIRKIFVCVYIIEYIEIEPLFINRLKITSTNTRLKILRILLRSLTFCVFKKYRDRNEKNYTA